MFDSQTFNSCRSNFFFNVPLRIMVCGSDASGESKPCIGSVPSPNKRKNRRSGRSGKSGKSNWGKKNTCGLSKSTPPLSGKQTSTPRKSTRHIQHNVKRMDVEVERRSIGIQTDILMCQIREEPADHAEELFASPWVKANENWHSGNPYLNW